MPYEFDPRHIDTLINEQFPTKIHAIREALQNGGDAIMEFNTNNKQKEIGKLEIFYEPNKKLIFRDNGHGVITSELLRRVGTTSKLGKRLAGNKGIGRFALLKVGDAIHIYCRTAEDVETKYFIMDKTDVYSQPAIYNTINSHGSVWEVINPQLDEPIEEMRECVKRWCSLNICRGLYSIELNGQRIKPTQLAKEQDISSTNYGMITGWLYADTRGNGSVAYYNNGLLVDPVLFIDPNRKFSGYVNFDAVPLIITRDSVDKSSTQYKTMLAILKRYVQRFPSNEEIANRKFDKMLSFIEKMSGLYLDKYNLSFEGAIAKRDYIKSGKYKGKKNKNPKNEEEQIKNEDIDNQIHKKHNVDYQTISDKTKPTVDFEPPNILQINQLGALVQTIDNKPIAIYYCLFQALTRAFKYKQDPSGNWKDVTNEQPRIEQQAAHLYKYGEVI